MNPRRSVVRTICLTIALTLLALVGSTGPASAAPGTAAVSISQVATAVPTITVGDEGAAPVGNVCGNKASQAQAADSRYLPVNRWSSAATDFHVRQGSGFFSKLSSTSFRTSLMGMGMAFGNTTTSLATDLSAFAINFCLMNAVGGSFDKVGAQIGKILLDSSVIVLLLVLTIVNVAFRALRTGSIDFKSLFQKALVVGLFGLMLAGAGASKGGGINNSDAPFQPGLGSPGWFTVKIDKVIGELSSSMSLALSKNMSIQGANTATAHPMSCAKYVDGLHNDYIKAYGDTSLSQARAAIPLTMSAIWETTGMAAWRAAQFGEANPYSEHSYCRILEVNSGSSKTAMQERLKSAGMKNVPDSGMALFTRRDNDKIDRSLVAWAACRSTDGQNWTWAREQSGTTINRGSAQGALLTKDDGDDTDASASCAKWWNGEDTDVDAFDWGNGTGDISDAFKDETSAAANEAEDFLTSLHETKSISGITAVLVYAISSVCLLVVFGGISIAIILSKIAAVMLIMAAFFVLAASLLPNAEPGKAITYFKTLAGVLLFSAVAQLIFMLIAIIAGLLTNAGASALPGGPSGILSMLWAGLSPLLGVAVIHWVFKKVLRLPSPFKMSGGMAWAQSPAVAGGSGMAGLDRLERRGLNAARNRIPGAGRIPGGRVAAAAGGAGLGAAAGRAGAMPVDRTGAAALREEFDKENPRLGAKAAGSVAAGAGAAAGAVGGVIAGSRLGQAAGGARTVIGGAVGSAGEAIGGTRVGQGLSATAKRVGETKVGSALGSAASSFKEKPFRTTAKYAAVGSLVAATGGSWALAPMGAAAYKGVKVAGNARPSKIAEKREHQFTEFANRKRAEAAAEAELKREVAEKKAAEQNAEALARAVREAAQPQSEGRELFNDPHQRPLF